MLPFCLFWVAARVLVERASGHLGRRLLLPAAKPGKKPKKRPKRLAAKDVRRLEKFQESVWKLFAYGSLVAYGIWVVHDEPWTYDSATFWSGGACPRFCREWPACSVVEYKASVKLYYAAELGFYLPGIVMLLVWETRRKDFLVMLAHHLVTVALLVASHRVSLLRVGAVIMLLHDISDIPLEAAKMLNYVRWEEGSTAMFAVFVVAWVATRLVYFPFYVIRSAMFEAHTNCPRKSIPNFEAFYYGFNSLLLALCSFHIYWTYLIFLTLWRKLAVGRIKDSREFGDSDSD